MEKPAIAIYASERVRFAYPANWTSEVDDSEEGKAITLQSQGVSFAVVGIYPDAMEPAELVDQVIESLREEHAGLEVDEPEEDWHDMPDAIAAEALFISLDMVSYCWVRSWRVAGQTLLVFVQSIEPESKMAQGVFNAICRSFVAQ